MSNSSQASVDPEGLRQLAGDLSRLASTIHELGQDLDNKLARLGETFRDEHYHEFRSVVLGSSQMLTAFADEVRTLAPKLRQDAEDIAASQRIRLNS